MQRPKPAINEIYHIYNRGVDKRTIFMNDADHLRFIHDLYEFNDQEPTQNALYYFKKARYMEVGLPIRRLLVEILAFCLMPNHFHMVVKQITDNGLTIFMRK